MKILYAIQGTGNGHLVRAGDVIPALQKKCTVDILVSGTQADVNIRYPIKYRLNGLSFIFGKKGGVDIWRTFSDSKLRLLRKEIKSLPVEDYDLVVNDFEPVSAWACRQKKVPCISLGHQASLMSPNVPKPGKIDLIGSMILRCYAPSNYRVGFHFDNYDKNIFTPVIRKEVREHELDDLGHYTVYLPSYNDTKLIETLSLVRNARWQVFSKHNVRTIQKDNIVIHPVSLDHFTASMATAKGVLCGAGFETPAEALYLGKKLMVIPMKGQLEQHFNAEALKRLGVPVINKLKPRNVHKIDQWTKQEMTIKIEYKDILDAAVNRLFEYYFETFHESSVPDAGVISIDTRPTGSTTSG